MAFVSVSLSFAFAKVDLKAVLQLVFGSSNTLALFGLGAICRWGTNEKGFSDKEGPLEYQRNVEIPGCIEKVCYKAVNMLTSPEASARSQILCISSICLGILIDLTQCYICGSPPNHNFLEVSS